jgi:hypothetical protein
LIEVEDKKWNATKWLTGKRGGHVMKINLDEVSVFIATCSKVLPFLGGILTKRKPEFNAA